MLQPLRECTIDDLPKIVTPVNADEVEIEITSSLLPTPVHSRYGMVLAIYLKEVVPLSPLSILSPPSPLTHPSPPWKEH